MKVHIHHVHYHVFIIRLTVMGRHSFTGIQIQLANLTIVKLHILLFCSRASFAFRLPCSTTAVVVVPPRPEKFEEPTCFSLRLRISSCTRLLGQFQELPNSSIQPPEPSATMCKWMWWFNGNDALWLSGCSALFFESNYYDNICHVDGEREKAFGTSYETYCNANIAPCLAHHFRPCRDG